MNRNPPPLTTPVATAAAPSPEPTPVVAAVSPSPTLPARDPTTFDPGWTVVAWSEGAGERAESYSTGRVAADGYFDVRFACEGGGDIEIRIIDAEATTGAGSPPVREHSGITTACTTNVEAFTAPTGDRETALTLEVTVEEDATWWAMLAVPDADVVP